MADRNPFRIDKFSLDKECTRHPEDVHEYMMKLADAKLAAEEAEQVYIATKADLDKRIRARPAKFGITKLTEGAVQAAMRNTKEYNEAKTLKSQTQYEVDVLYAAVTALSHKRDMITSLISLFKMDYFSNLDEAPKTRKELRTDSAKSKGGVRKE